METSPKIIENWFYRINSDELLNILHANRLIRNLSDYFANLKTYKILTSIYKDIDTDNVILSKLDNIELLECSYYNQFTNTEYKYFIDNDQKLGFLSSYIQCLKTVVYFLFNDISKDNSDSPLFSGIMRYPGFLGSIKNNLPNGFALQLYNIRISRHYEWNMDEHNPDAYPRYTSESVFYSGNWLDGRKHGIGIILKYDYNFYCGDYSTCLEDRLGYTSSYIFQKNANSLCFIGQWQNDKLVKIFTQDEPSLRIISQMVNYTRKNNRESEGVIEAREANNVKLDEVSKLFETDIVHLNLLPLSN